MFEDMKYSPGAVRLIELAGAIAMEQECNSIHPIHILLAALKKNYDLNEEYISLYQLNIEIIKCAYDLMELRNTCNEFVQILIKGSSYINVCIITKKILLEANKIAQLYEEHGQIYVNDSRILRTIFNSEDKLIQQCLSDIDKELLISLITSPKDMIVDLNNEFSISTIDGVLIRKVTENDKEALKEFVLRNFYERWAKTVEYGLSLNEIPIYIALVDDKIVGFAGYNISKQRKGHFGPLGVLRVYRDKKIGQTLLINCLIDMKSLGFKTCIIGNASSIEFYEKACRASVMPLSK